jgi:hypothetical protein
MLSNILSNSALSLMLNAGASMPLLALHNNGSHVCNIFNFTCMHCFILLSSISSAPKSLASLNRNAAWTIQSNC